jgi:hypothetical protein
MVFYKDCVTVFLSKQKQYFAFHAEDKQYYWLCKGHLITCDCACNNIYKELQAHGILEEMSWAGKFAAFFFYLTNKT